MSNFSVVIPSDHESKITVEERKAVNTRQREWQMQSKHGYKRVSLQPQASVLSGIRQ